MTIIITLIVLVTLGFIFNEYWKNPTHKETMKKIFAMLIHEGNELVKALKQIRKDFEKRKTKSGTRQREITREMKEKALKNFRESKRKYDYSYDLSAPSRRTHFEPEDFDRWYRQSKHNTGDTGPR